MRPAVRAGVMRLTVVGCSGSVSGPDSPASCYLVQAPHQGRTFSLLLDLGPGAFGALYRYLDPSTVDAIALSHLHPDHCLDLCAFYVAARYSATAPWPRLPLHGPAGTARRLAAAYDIPLPAGVPSEPGPGIGDHFDYHDWQVEQQIGPFHVRTTRVEHSAEAYAMRLEERSGPAAPNGDEARAAVPAMVFSGDTGPAPALVELAGGADLLLVEAAFLDSPDNPPGLHLSGRQAALVGREAGVSTVVLTHIPPWHDPAAVLDEAVAASSAEVSLAAPGRSWTLG